MFRTGHFRYRRNRARLMREHGDMCACVGCGQPIDFSLKWPDPWSFTADHIEAVHLGGRNDGPLQPMHARCNIQRGNRRSKPPVRHSRKW